MIELMVNIDVPDLEPGIAFYRDGLGLQLARRLFDGTVAELHGAAVPVYLLEKPTGSATSATRCQARDYARHWTPVHLDIVVADLEHAIARATQAGARRESDIADHAWGRLAVLSDPFGHGFCLLQWSGSGYADADA